MRTTTMDVLIIGAGPTGLTLATALAARGRQSTVVDRQAAGAITSQAAVVHTRTLEVLESIGVADRRVRLGVQTPRFTIRDRVLVPVHCDTLPTKHPYALMISQTVTEVVLLECFAEFGG
jgi:2-polyprenyl-6-methoxyphenol hydroxylase-like FAD-dependent oxidoreductase